MDLVQLAVGVLATYRLTLMLHEEMGPGDVFERFRCWLAVSPMFFNPGPDGDVWRTVTKMFECYWCLSVWVALEVAIVLRWPDPVSIIGWALALSGGAVLLYEVTSHGKSIN